MRIGALLVVSVSLASGSVFAQVRADDFKPVKGVRELSGSLLIRPHSSPILRPRGAATAAKIAKRELAGLDIYVVPVPKGLSERAYSNKLMSTGLFEYAAPNWIVYPARAPNDPLLNSQWHHNKLESRKAWDILTGQRPSDPVLTIAVCDTGVNAVPDLAAGLLLGYNSYTRTTQAAGGVTSDINGHGTMVAGCAAAQADNNQGVAGMGWNFHLLPVRVTNNPNGSATTADILDGIYWAGTHGAQVVNVSYTGVANPAIETAGAALRSSNCILVYSAGNDSTQLSSFDHPNVIIVGATESDDSKWPLSNWGDAIDCVAPGVNIRTTLADGGFGTDSGTSFSAPIVAGTLGLIWSQDRSLTPAQVELSLYKGCFDLGDFGSDAVFGYGRINPYRSLQSMLRYSIRDLTANSPYSTTIANDLNAGSEAVGLGIIGRLQYPILFTGGSVLDIGIPPGSSFPEARGINVSGEIVGRSAENTYYWNGTSSTQLQTVAGHHGALLSSINSSGNIVAGMMKDGVQPKARSFYYQNYLSAPIELQMVAPYDECQIFRIDDSGVIVGQIWNAALNLYRACCWSSYVAQPVILTTASPNTTGAAFASDSAGTIAGSVYSSALNNHLAAAYRGTVGYPLANINGTIVLSQCRSINSAGMIVGFTYLPGDVSVATVWQNGFPLDLNTVIDPGSPGWHLNWATSVNDAGQVLGGGVINGENHAFIATPYIPGGVGALTVNCGVVLSSYAANGPSVPVSFEVRRALTNDLVGTYTVTRDAITGYYHLPVNIRGLYKVKAWASHWLAQRIDNVIVSDGGTQNADFSLINGDANGDNEVNQTDEVIILELSGYADFAFNSSPYLSNADLNGDGVIDWMDVAIVRANLGLHGD